MKHPKKYYIAELSKVGKFIYYTKAAKFWADGDGVSFNWNYWNPISWPLIIITIILLFLLVGITEFKRNLPDIGIGQTKYWQDKEKEYF